MNVTVAPATVESVRRVKRTMLAPPSSPEAPAAIATPVEIGEIDDRGKLSLEPVLEEAAAVEA